MHKIGRAYFAESLDAANKKGIARVPVLFTTANEIANWMAVSVDNKAESSVIAMLKDKFGEDEVVDSPRYVVLADSEPNPESDTPYVFLLVELLEQLRLLPNAPIVCITTSPGFLTVDMDIHPYRCYIACDIIGSLTQGTDRLIYSDIPKFEGDARFTSADIIPHKSDSGWTFPQYVGDISRISDAGLLHVRKYNLELLSHCLASGLTGLRKPHHQKGTPDIGKSAFDSLTLHLPIVLSFVKLLSHGRIDLRQVACIREYLNLFAKCPEKVEIIDCHVSCDLSDPNVERYLYMLSPTDEELAMLDELQAVKEQLEGVVEIWQKTTYRAGLDIVYLKICEAYKKRTSEEAAATWDAIGNAMGIYSQVDAFLDGVPLEDVLA